MNDPLFVFARIESSTDQVELVKSALISVVGATRKESGCIKYDLHQDTSNPEIFFMYEIWESAEDLNQHAKTPHFNAFLKATDGAIASFSVNQTSQHSAA